MKDNLLKKFISFSYGSWFGLIIGVLTTMITTRILSPDNFGKSSMFTTALNVLVLIVIFGTDQSFVRLFYEEEEEKRGGLLYNCIRIPFVLSIALIILIIVFNKEITLYLFGERNFLMAVILGIDVIIQVIHRYAVLVIRMQQRGNLYSILAILTKVLDFVLLLLFYYLLGNKYEIIIFSSVLTAFILTIYLVIKDKNYWKIGNRNISGLKHSKGEIFNYAYPLVLNSMIYWLFTSFDKIALKEWSTFSEIGYYSAASKIVALLTVLQGSFTTFWTPVCYEHYEKFPEDNNLFTKMSKVITIAMFALSIISIAGKDLIVLLLGSSYREAANIMPFLVFMPIMYTISETTVIGINFAKKPKWHILISGTSCLINIIGNLILVPELGAKGAAISTAFSYILFFSMRTHISLKYYKVNYGLSKMYIMLAIIFVYALLATFSGTPLTNLLIGIVVFVFLCILYFNDIKNLYNIYFKKILKLIRNRIFYKY